MEFVQLFTLGLAVGFLSSFFGIGGGSLIVPVLYAMYDKIPPSIVIPISLGSIFIIVLLNTYKYFKQKLLPKRDLILNFIIFCGVGAYLGSEVVYLINNQMAKFSMGIILILMVVKLLLMKKKETPDHEDYKPNKILFALTGLLGSFLSSITGLGGGIIFTPFFMNILRVPTIRVSPYANMAMAVTTLIGIAPHLFKENSSNFRFENFYNESVMLGNVHFGIIVLIAISASLTSPLGVKLNLKVSANLKRSLLAALLSFFALKLLFF